jgi:hypothetical protein
MRVRFNQRAILTLKSFVWLTRSEMKTGTPSPLVENSRNIVICINKTLVVARSLEVRVEKTEKS